MKKSNTKTYLGMEVVSYWVLALLHGLRYLDILLYMAYCVHITIIRYTLIQRVHTAQSQ
jgi:hypothetical protein